MVSIQKNKQQKFASGPSLPQKQAFPDQVFKQQQMPTISNFSKQQQQSQINYNQNNYGFKCIGGFGGSAMAPQSQARMASYNNISQIQHQTGSAQMQSAKLSMASSASLSSSK